MSDLIAFPDSFGAVAHRDAGSFQDDLAAGLSSSFGVLSIQGKVFRIRYGGNETPLVDARKNPLPQLDVVIVGASPHVSRTYYEGGFEANAGRAPTCSSSDGKVPDARVENPPARSCLACPYAVRDQVTPTNAKVSKCANNKRIAIVPLGDLENEQFGGPMLLRIPGGSLKSLTNYAQALKSKRFHSYEVATTLQFDFAVAHPRLVFSPLRPLTPDEQHVINDMRAGGQLNSVLATSDMEHGEGSQRQPVNADVAAQNAMDAFPVKMEHAQPASPVKVTPKNKVTRPVKSQIAEAVNDPVTITPPQSFEADLDAKLKGLM
jgi:hypothetical protein